MAGWRRTLEDIALVSAALNSADAAQATRDAGRRAETERQIHDEWLDHSHAYQAGVEKGLHFFDSAEEHRSNREWESAIYDYAVALDAFPEDAHQKSSGMFLRQECRLNRARCFRELGDLGNAVLECIELYARPLAPDVDFARKLQTLVSEELSVYRVSNGNGSVRSALERIRAIDREIGRLRDDHQAAERAFRARRERAEGMAISFFMIGLIASLIFGLFGAAMPDAGFWFVAWLPLPFAAVGVLVGVLAAVSMEKPVCPSTDALTSEREAIAASIVWLAPPIPRGDGTADEDPGAAPGEAC